jgi:hypothetical protein
MTRTAVVGNLARNENPGPRDSANKKHVFLERWKARARARQKKLAKQLQAAPLSVQRIQNIKVWLENLEARRLWLEARLEHIKAVESIMAAALKPKPPSE